MKRNLLLFLFLSISYYLSAQGKITSVTIEKTPCLGKCPWYILSIESNGNVTYTGKKNATFDGVMRGKLPKAEVNKLLNKYRSKPYWKLSNNYSSQTADLPKTHILIKSGSKTKSIRNAHEGPAWLRKFIQDIDNLERDKKIVWDKDTFIPNNKEGDEEL